jgi:hypothetical protein
MFVLVVDIKTDDFVLSPAVEREAVEVGARVVADAAGRRGIGLTNMLDGGRTIGFPSDFIPRGVGDDSPFTVRRYFILIYIPLM